MEKTYYWSDIAELTHETQVEEFGWCSCEEQEYFPYEDCPRLELIKHARCGNVVSFDEVTRGYYAQCPNCDEDVFSFETITEKIRGEN